MILAKIYLNGPVAAVSCRIWNDPYLADAEQ